jgi:RNA polymerase sigma factor (sigma-70 family)
MQAAPIRSDELSRADLDDFLSTRPRLFAIAHRIVGDAHEAEDVVQDVWLRWHRVDRAAVINAEAFLVTATARVAINLVQSARRRHETCVAPGLYEDTADRDAGLLADVERRETIALAAQLLEHLSPSERSAYVLREAFEYPYRQIAEALGIGAANARQLVKRARARVVAGRRQPYNTDGHKPLQHAFAVASRTGGLADVEAFLATDLNEASHRQARRAATTRIRPVATR